MNPNAHAVTRAVLLLDLKVQIARQHRLGGGYRRNDLGFAIVVFLIDVSIPHFLAEIDLDVSKSKAIRKQLWVSRGRNVGIRNGAR